MKESFALGGPFSCFVTLGKTHGEGTSVYCLPFTSGSGFTLRVSTGLGKNKQAHLWFCISPQTTDDWSRLLSDPRWANCILSLSLWDFQPTLAASGVEEQLPVAISYDTGQRKERSNERFKKKKSRCADSHGTKGPGDLSWGPSSSPALGPRAYPSPSE